MDELDRAQEREQQDRGLALEALRRKLDSEHAGGGSHECQGCGEEIDPRRRVAVPSATRCTECQERWEKYGA